MAILRAYGLQDEPFKAAVARSEPVGLVPGISAFAVYHCGARILNTHRKIEEQIRDWERIGAYLRAATKGPAVTLSAE